MKNLTKALLGAMATASALAGTARAEDAPTFTMSAAVAVQSDYRFRGISQNDKEPAPQATINISGPEGFYVGTWWSKTNWGLAGTGSPSYEADFYFGKHTDFFGLGDLNTQAYFYTYPDARTQGVANKNATFMEFITTFSHVFGPLTMNATWAYSPMFTLGGGNSNYINGNAVWAVNDWLSLSGTVGHQWAQAAKTFGSTDYTHYDIGGTVTYKSLALDIRYVDTDLSKASCSAFWMATNNACGGTAMATLTYNISSFPW